jgi:hypothetical protein
MPKKPQIVTEATGIQVLPGDIPCRSRRATQTFSPHLREDAQSLIRIVPGRQGRGRIARKHSWDIRRELVPVSRRFFECPSLTSLFQHRFVKPTHTVAQSLLACKRERPTSKTKHYDKKHWNAAVSHLSHSCWNHYALSRWHRCNGNGRFGARNRHFDLSRQVVGCAAISL